MVNNSDLIQRNLNHVWHPLTQMKDFESYSPLTVQSARGSYLYTDQGPVIDAISSWWCKSLGHGHPRVVEKIKKQLDHFEHIIGAGTAYPQIVELAETLTQLSSLQHVFFASDGASAVEIALKMSVYACQLRGEAERNQFIALNNGYHGDTLGALSVSDLGLYKEPYRPYGYPCTFIDVPYVNSLDDPLWNNAEESWTTALSQLELIKNKACALILEPLVQAATGLRLYSADFLKRLMQWAKKNEIYIIADEIMTGFARTGKWFATHYVDEVPDLLCISKGVTSGSLPLSAVLIDHSLYSLFYNNYLENKSFLHSHTYSGNALAVTAALATIETMQEMDILNTVKTLEPLLKTHFQAVANESQKLTNIRSLGAWVAGDLIDNGNPRLGFTVYQEALTQGALLRPIGNTVYWLPPLLTDENTIRQLAEITLNSIEAAYKR